MNGGRNQSSRPSPLRSHARRGTFYPDPGAPRRVRERTGIYRGIRRTDVTFPSSLPSGSQPVDHVRAVHLESPAVCDGTRVVLLHGLGLSRLDAWLSFGAALAARGFPTLLVELPHTCSRRLPGERAGARYMSLDADRALPAFEQAVADVRSARRWLAGRDDAPRPTALAGISLGAVIVPIAAALEPAFTCIVPILGGGDLDRLIFGGTYGRHMRRALRRAGISEAQRIEAHAQYFEYLDAVRRAAHPLDVPAPLHYYLFDPLTFAWHLRARPTLMINARLDPIVPPDASRQLWLELGCPPWTRYWGTHWAGGPWRPFVTGRIADYLRTEESRAPRSPSDTRARPPAKDGT